jgi:hypothetical protein
VHLLVFTHILTKCTVQKAKCIYLIWMSVISLTTSTLWIIYCVSSSGKTVYHFISQKTAILIYFETFSAWFLILILSDDWNEWKQCRKCTQSGTILANSNEHGIQGTLGTTMTLKSLKCCWNFVRSVLFCSDFSQIGMYL